MNCRERAREHSQTQRHSPTAAASTSTKCGIWSEVRLHSASAALKHARISCAHAICAGPAAFLHKCLHNV